jgi:GMP synthase-like glutamine amidotransferase
MALRLLVVQNDWDKSLGRIAEVLVAEGVELDVRMSSEDLPHPAAYDGLVTLPGLADPEDEDAPIRRVRLVTERALEAELPVLGICLGGQLLVQALGGETYRSREELGFHDVRATPAAAGDPLLADMPRRFPVFHAHAYAFRPPAGAVTLLENDVCVQACRLGDAWAFQCHPEPTLAWVTALARGIDGTVEGIDPRTVGFFRSNGIEPEALEAGARNAAVTAGVLACSIATGFKATMQAARGSLRGRA